MRNNKRHTKPCIYFQTNTCPLSAEECDYAHVLARPEQAELLKNPQETLRTKPCRYFLAGQCRDGFWCRFKHPVADLQPGKPAESIEKGTENSADAIDVRELKGAWKAKPNQHPKYQTRPCRNFLLGKCIYGERCSYLHAAPSPASSMCGSQSPYFSSPTTMGTTFPITAPVTPPYLPRLPSTSLPTRVPNCTPVPEFELGAPAIFEIVGPANSVHDRGNRPQTPSNSSASSQLTDWPPTPASLQLPGGHANTYPPESPFSPATPPYDTSQHVTKNQLAACLFSPTPLQTPPTPPYTMYPPTSSVPLTVLHVPVTVPFYQSIPTLDASSIPSPTTRQRAVTQPGLERGKLAPGSLDAHFRTKPCRFFFGDGRCHKGDRCNFLHSRDVSKVPSSTSSAQVKENTRKRTAKRSATPKLTSDRPNNFYRINWRVLGGGVRMSNDAMSSQGSDDLSLVPCQRESLGSSFLLGEPITFSTTIHSPQDSSVGPHGENLESTSTSTRSSRKSINALALNLQPSKLNDINTNNTRPIIIVQDEDNGPVNCEAGHERPSSVLENADDREIRTRVMRSKSSPSTPVSAHLDLPSLLFSAEMP